MIQAADRIGKVEEYYFSRKLREVRDLDAKGLKVINLGIGSPDLPPAPRVVEALHQTAEAPGSHGYQSYKGIPALRNAIADFNQRIYGVPLDPECEILPLMGSKEGIMHVSLAFLNEGETVLIPDPGYPTYQSVSRLVGANVKTYALTEPSWRIDFEALASMDLSSVKILWINYPHMPTGSRAEKGDLVRLVELAHKHQFLIVNDNPYSLILNDRPTSILSIDGAKDVALELNSLSKSHNMAGWRVGWVAGSAAHVEAVLRVKSNMDSGMFLGLQTAAVEALKLGPSWFDQLNETYKQRQKFAFEILDLLECEYTGSQSGLFVWARAPYGIGNVEEWIDEILYGAKVFITPGFIFGEGGRRYIRISLCASTEVMKGAHDRLQKFLATKNKATQKV